MRHPSHSFCFRRHRAHAFHRHAVADSALRVSSNSIQFIRTLLYARTQTNLYTGHYVKHCNIIIDFGNLTEWNTGIELIPKQTIQFLRQIYDFSDLIDAGLYIKIGLLRAGITPARLLGFDHRGRDFEQIVILLCRSDQQLVIRQHHCI